MDFLAIYPDDPAVAHEEGRTECAALKHTANTRERPPDPFVGREHELGELQGGLTEAFAGRGDLFLLVGEPGIGKTRLADEFCVQAQAAGALVFWGRCWEGGGAPAYWPWVQVMRSYLRQSDPVSLADELGAGAAHIAQIVPELREAIPATIPATSTEAEDVRFGFFDAMSTFLRRAASRQSLVLVLDDLQAADRPSLLLLQFMVRELRGSKLLVIGSYRDAEARRDPEVGALLGALGRDGKRMPLRGLSEEHVAEVIRRAGSSSPDASLARAIHQVTEGNPFFVDEVVRLLRADGRLEGSFSPGESLGIPDAVRDAIGQRLASLSDETSQVLSVAAVVGRDFDARVVERTTGLAAEDVLAALDEAVAAEIVVEALLAMRRYSFSHALVRETLHDALPAGRRAHLHLEVGAALEEIHGDDAVEHVAELAHHFFEGAAVGGAAKALELSARAGDQASEMLAYEDARAHYERAFQSMTLAGVSDSRRRCELLLRLAECEWRGGDSAAARATFQEAAGIARALPAPELLARAAIGYARGLGGFLHVVRADQTIIALLEEALTALEDRDTALRARLLARLAVELYYTDQVGRRVALSSEAIEMARRMRDPGSLLVALYSRHWAACGPETLDERLANATEMIELASELGDKEMNFLGHHVRLNCLLELCDIEPVDKELQAMVELAEEVRQPFYRWRTTCLSAMRAILDARFEDAERLADEAFELGRGSDLEIATMVREGAQLFALRFGQGRLAELEDSVLDLTRRYPWIQPWRLPLLYSELGREAEARAELERHAVRDFGDFPRDALWITRIAALTHACAVVGDTTRAEQLYELLLPYADRNVSTIADQSYGPVATRLGMLTATMGRWEEAAAHFDAARDYCRVLRAPTFTALNLSEHARMLLARGRPGDPERAVVLLAEAEHICRRQHIDGILERVLADRSRVEAPGEAEHQFRREGEYWTIAFEGDVFRMKDSKGMRYLAQLLANPGTELHVLDLVALAGAEPGDGRPAPSAAQVRQAGMRVSRLEGAGEALDAQAKTVYRSRLEELDAELEEARNFNDPEREARLSEELDALRQELTGAVGLGSRDRALASPAERARVNVTRSIRSSMARIEVSSPALADHLGPAIRTGTFCAYLPAPHSRVAWRL